MTGMTQIYWRHYVNRRIRDVHARGVYCPIEVVANALREYCQGVYNNANDGNDGDKSMRTGGNPIPRVAKGGDR